MHLPTNRQSESLPASFPVGAKYVIEGRGGADGRLRVWSRYVVLPSGRRLDVLADLQPSPRASVTRRSGNLRKAQNAAAGGKSRPTQRRKKIIGRGGTARQQGR